MLYDMQSFVGEIIHGIAFVEYAIWCSRMQPMKRLNSCASGGYSKLQTLLLHQKDIKCKACKEIVDSFDFSYEDMQKVIDDCVEGSRDVKTAGKGWNTKQEDKEEDITLDALVPAAKKSRKEKAANEEGEVIAWVRTLEPTICLLPPGSFGKRVPYRCNICFSGRWPQGRIGEASEMKLGPVKHFIGNHLRSETHKRKAREADGPSMEIEPDKFACEGINVSDPVSGQVLYPLRENFHLWATVANFSETGKHKYSYDASDHWWTITWSGSGKSTKPEQSESVPTVPHAWQAQASSAVPDPLYDQVLHGTDAFLPAFSWSGRASRPWGADQSWCFLPKVQWQNELFDEIDSFSEAAVCESSLAERWLWNRRHEELCGDRGEAVLAGERQLHPRAACWDRRQVHLHTCWRTSKWAGHDRPETSVFGDLRSFAGAPVDPGVSPAMPPKAWQGRTRSWNARKT